MKKTFKVLLIYPSLFMQTGLPLGIASLVAALNKEGIDAKVFDTTFYREEGDIDENSERAEVLHSVKSIDYGSVGISKKNTRMAEDFLKIIGEYKPDLIGLSAIESIFDRGLKLTRLAKKTTGAPIIAGGVFATLAPEIVIREESIDMLCIGEGEDALVELCKRLRSGEDHLGIGSLWIKNNGNVIKNRLLSLKPLDLVAEPEFSCFDPKMFYRPMQGNIFKTIPIELARGCPYQCTYCGEPSLSRLYKKNGERGYFRTKSMERYLAEIERGIKKYSPDFFYFATETFLAIDDKMFNEFIDGYRKIKIPFWIQTRVETISYERLRKLKEVGLFWLTIGIEHGNEGFRKKYLKRDTKNDQIVEVIKMLDKCDQGVSLNSIIGFPFETRELIYDTMLLNKRLFNLNKRIRSNISIFTPFRGCELYELCVSNNLLRQQETSYTSHTNITGGSLIKFDSLTDEQLNGLFRTFNLYVYLPDEYTDRIKTAEHFTPEGNREFNALSKITGDYLSSCTT